MSKPKPATSIAYTNCQDEVEPMEDTVKSKIPFEWEILHSASNDAGAVGTIRAKVLGGWIVKCHDYFNNFSISTTFVPDPNHEWEI